MAEKGNGKHAGGRPRKFSSPEEMQVKIEAYFAKCDARVVREVVSQGGKKVLVDVPKPEPYTVQGLAVFLDLTMEGLQEYERRDEYSGTVTKAKLRIEANKAVRLNDGVGWGPGIIFDLKNNHKWKDSPLEVSAPGGGPLVILRADTSGQGPSE